MQQKFECEAYRGINYPNLLLPKKSEVSAEDKKAQKHLGQLSENDF